MEDDNDMQQEGASPEYGNSTTKDIMVEIKELHKKHGGNLNKIALALNDLGFKSPQGLEWKYNNLRSYLESRAPELLGYREKKPKLKSADKKSKVKQKPQQKPHERPVEANKPEPNTQPRVTPPPPQPDPLVAFVKLPDQSLTFVDGKTKSGSFKALESLYRLAEEKAKKDKVRTGGSMSSLVEVLLWAYVNGPKEFLVPLYIEESAGTEMVTDETPKKKTGSRTKTS